jgi:4'-phosphopantetheinyl transferase
MAGLQHNGGSLRGALSIAGQLHHLGQPRLWLLALDGTDALWVSDREQAWAQRLPAQRRQRYLRSRGLLRRQLAALLQLPAQEVALHSPPGEAPSLAEGAGHVSLSHSRDQLLLAWSPWPIGVDLEWHQRAIQAELLARRFFPPQEWHHLQRLAPAERQAAVLESWVCKEAAIKWQRSSLASDLRHWCWNANLQQLQHLQQGWQPACLTQVRNGWLCAVVGEAAEQGIWG